MKTPQIKKQLSAFLLGEEGKISKQNIVKTGLIIGTIGFVGAITLKNAKAAGLGSHGSHGSHSSHSNVCVQACGTATCPTGEHVNSLGMTKSAQIVSGSHAHCIKQHASGSG